MSPEAQARIEELERALAAKEAENAELRTQVAALTKKVEELTDRTQSLVKERDTERSRITLIERDKKELEQQLNDARAKLAAAAAKEGAAATP